MASRNIFESVFNPSDNSSPFAQMTGTLGKMMGVPNDAQIQGQANAQVFQKLSQLEQQNGGNLQKAVLDFYRSPQGLELGSRDPQGMANTVKQWVSNVTAPNPQLTSPGQQGFETNAMGTKQVLDNPPLPQQTGPGVTNTGGRSGQPIYQAPYAPQAVGPNTTMLDPNSGTTIAQTDPAKVAELKGMSREAGFNNNQTQRVFRAETTSIAGREALAVQDMIDHGDITAEWGRKLDAKTLEFKPERNNFGKEDGSWGLYDKATGQKIKTFKNIPDELKPRESTEGAFDINNPEDTPHLASGVLGMGASEYGKGLRQLTDNPTDVAKRTQLISERRSQLYDINAAVAALADAQSGMSGREAVVKRILAKGPDLGYNVDTKYQLSQLRSLRSDIEKEKEADVRLIRGSGDTPGDVISDKVKEEASARLPGYDRVLRVLPTWRKLSAAQALCDKGDCGGENLSRAVKDVKDTTSAGVDAAAPVVKQQTPNKAGIDPNKIPTMSPEETAKINPADLPADQRVLLLKRLQEIRGQMTTPQPAPATGPSQQPAPQQQPQPAQQMPAPSPELSPLPQSNQGFMGNPFSTIGSWFTQPGSQEPAIPQSQPAAQPGQGWQQRRQMNFQDEVTPGRPQDVQSFIRNPDGSLKSKSEVQNRIDQAFKDLKNEPSAASKRKPAPKRRP